MGFWDSFLGHAAANAISEIKKDERDNKKWNDLFYELSDYETEFTDFLESIGSPAIYCFDVEYVNSGNIVPEKRKIDSYRRKINQYLELGGEGRFIDELDDLDDYIEKVKFLKAHGCLDRQAEFYNDSIYDIKKKFNNEKKDIGHANSAPHQKEFNECTLEYQGEIDITRTNVIYDVKLWDSDKQMLNEFPIKIVYNSSTFDLFYEETGASLGSFPIPEDIYCEVTVSDLEDSSKKAVEFGQSIFVMSTDDAVKFKAYYDKLDLSLEEKLNKKQETITELVNNIHGIDTLATNLVNGLDNINSLLNHDSVILMQLLWSYDRIRNIKVYDKDASQDENVLQDIAYIQALLESMAEIVLEENELTEQDVKCACWEAIKCAAIKHYSNIWESRYGIYINEPLKNNEASEADGTLDKYIENIIMCNEIETTDKMMIAIFTYYMMDKGYTVGKPYFPAYYDIMIQAFDVIKKNVGKTQIKELLKGNVSKSEKHYSIDDVDMMNGSEFESFVCEMYKRMGYSAEVTKQTGDQGLDVIAERNGNRIGIQAKCYSGTVGNSAVQEAVAGKNYYHCDKVVVITNNYFTQSAVELAKANDVILWNRDILKEKLKEIM